MNQFVGTFRLLAFVLALCLVGDLSAATTRKKSSAKKKTATVAAKRVSAVRNASHSKLKKASANKVSASRRKSGRRATQTLQATRRGKKNLRHASARRGRSAVPGHMRFVAGGPWLEPTYADSTSGDTVDGEDLTVRRAAVDALGPYNGTVVVADPHTGRVLTIVNQKVALGQGYQPCSTVKIYAALAGLNEGIVDRANAMRLYGRTYMNLTDALARSNNPYFANIGVRLGYDRIAYYARMYGLGEKALLNEPSEQLGTIPPAPPANGGMGMMTSFGEGIRLTPLQLASTLVAIANGGTLYHLQYPRSEQDVANLVPRVKRQVPVQQVIHDLLPGMSAAVEFGTARRAYYSSAEPIFGKTGTCTDRATPTHLGWFGSFNEVEGRKLVVVVLLTGGAAVNGPVASGIAGQIYRNLSQQRYFARGRQSVSPVALISGW